ncbi:hypothetical protein RUM44_002656 [Polyplax serrata]|uniref:Uncharacterized protein n=1 Tax=Polyplax serrata TaxID=468196 RepID=A0ABR1AFD2_POLSC
MSFAVLDVIPKDFYKRQILQPIPGYIPVYIQADGEAVFRRTSDISRGYPVKSVQHKQATSKVAPRVSKTEEKNLKEEKNVENAEAEVKVDNSKDKIKNSS